MEPVGAKPQKCLVDGANLGGYSVQRRIGQRKNAGYQGGVGGHNLADRAVTFLLMTGFQSAESYLRQAGELDVRSNFHKTICPGIWPFGKVWPFVDQ
jgi:hypothetical protein